jgi:biotin carboxylase
MTALLAFVESNTTGSGMLALIKARAMGFEPVLLSNDPRRYRGLESTRAEVAVCDTNSLQAVAVALEGKVGGAELAGITTTSEFYLETAARLAARLRLPSNPAEAIATCRDKARTREALRGAGMTGPRFAVVHLEDDIDSAIGCVGLPCVVKPVDDTGSFEVRHCTSAEEAAAQCRRVLALRRNVRGQRAAGVALVEEYLDGPEFSVELLSWQGAAHTVGVTEKRLGGLPYFVESGHLFPAPLPDRITAALAATAIRALVAVGVTHGASHVELKLVAGECVVVEINARPAGGMIPEVVRLAHGVDLVEGHLRAAVGVSPWRGPGDGGEGAAAIAFLLPHRDGRLRGVVGLERARAVPGLDEVTLTMAAGTRVRRPQSAYDRVGYMLGHGATPEAAAACVRAARDNIDLIIADGDEPGERP